MVFMLDMDIWNFFSDSLIEMLLLPMHLMEVLYGERQRSFFSRYPFTATFRLSLSRTREKTK
jgi:hypothetical protein